MEIRYSEYMFCDWLQLTAIATNNFLLTVPQGSEDGIRIEGLLFGNLGWQLVPGSSPPMVSAFVTPNSGTSTASDSNTRTDPSTSNFPVRVKELCRLQDPIRARFTITKVDLHVGTLDVEKYTIKGFLFRHYVITF